jgi:TP901 family phage tail tape measure protein/lambda family phage tail tape measure protein
MPNISSNPNLTLKVTAAQAAEQFAALTTSAAALRKELAALNTTPGRSPAVVQLNRGIKQLNSELAATRAELRNVTDAYNQQTQIAVRSIREQTAAVKTAEAEKQAAIKKTSAVESEAIATRARLLRTADAGTLRSAARGVAASAGGVVLTYGSSIPIIAGGFAAGALARGAFLNGSQFSYQSAFGGVLANQTDAQVKQLKSDLLDLSRGSIYSPTELAKGFTALAQGGLSAHDSLVTLPVAMKTALQGEVDLRTASEGLLGTLREFDLPLTKISQAGNEISKTAAVTLANVPDVIGALKNTTGLAKYGVQLPDVLSSLGVLAKQGIVGPRAGTLVRNLFQEIYSPRSSKAASAQRTLGISTVNEATGQLKPALQVLTEIQQALAKLRPADQAKALSQLFNQRALRAGLNILLESTQQFKAFRAEIVNSSGSLQEFQDRLSEQPLYQYKVALAAVGQAEDKAFNSAGTAALLRSVNDVLESPGFTSGLKNFVSGLTSVAQFAADHSSGIYALLKGYLAFKGAALGSRLLQPLLSTLGAIGTKALEVFTGRVGLAGVLGTVGRVLLGITSPLGWILTALTTAGSLWLAFGHNADSAQKAAGSAAKQTNETLDQQIARLREINGLQGQNELSKARETADATIKKAGATYTENVKNINADYKAGKLTEQARDQALAGALATFKYVVDPIQKKLQEVAQLSAPKKQETSSAGVVAGTGRFAPPNNKLNTALARGQADFYSSASQYYEKFFQNRLKQLGMEHQYGLVSDTTYQAQVDAVGQQRLDVQTKLLAGERQELQQRMAAATDDVSRERIKQQLAQANQKLADAQLKQTELTREISIRQQGQIKRMDLAAQKTIREQAARNQVNIERQRQSTLGQLLSTGGQAEQAAGLRVISGYTNAIVKAEQQLQELEQSPGVAANDPRLLKAKAVYQQLKENEALQVDIAKEAARENDDWQRSWEFGARSALTEFNDTATNSAQNFRDVFSAATDGATADLDAFVKTGKLSLNNFAQGVVNAGLKIAENRTVNSIFNILADLLPWPGQAAGGGQLAGAQGAELSVEQHHTGGVAGLGRVYRNVSAALFDFAPRYHGGGVAGDEVPAILKRGELVLTQAQARALAPAGSGGDVFNLNTVINAETGETTVAGDSSAAAKQLADVLKAKVMQTIIEQKRPGGLLAKAG